MAKWKRNPSDDGKELTSAEYKKAREDKAFDLFADMLIKKIESAEKTNWQKPWFAEGQIAWPKALYGKSYHGMNALMLSLLCEEKDYKIPVFATSDRIHSLNYTKDGNGNRSSVVDDDGNKRPFVHVLKGEHSFPVFVTNVNVVHKETKEKIKWREYNALSEQEKANYNVYRNRLVHLVFNVDQTNIKESRPELYERLVEENVPKKVEYDESQIFNFEPLDILIDKQEWICPINVRELRSGDSPHFSPTKNEVVLGEKKQYVMGGHPTSWVNDAFHEMIHSTGHKDCLDRLKPTTDKDSYAREELVAEVSAALSCHRYGIPNTIQEDSIPYVQSWLSNLREKPEFIRTVLKDVKAASSVLDCKIEEIRRLYLNEREEDKLDIREEEESCLEVDDTGDVQLSSSESLAADKKQGEGEGREPAVKEEQKRGGIHR